MRNTTLILAEPLKSVHRFFKFIGSQPRIANGRRDRAENRTEELKSRLTEKRNRRATPVYSSLFAAFFAASIRAWACRAAIRADAISTPTAGLTISSWAFFKSFSAWLTSIS